MSKFYSILIKDHQEPCPNCGILIDLDPTKYRLNEKVIESCPWCGRKLRITKKLRQRPKDQKGIYFIVRLVKKLGSGRR